MIRRLGELLPDMILPPDLAALAISGIAIDSRKVVEGDLFLAAPGETVDGRNFIEAAVQAGAVAVLAESGQQGTSVIAGVPMIQVPGLREKQGLVAARFHGSPAARMRCIGVTGTNGKTSVAWFLQAAFSALEEPCALVGTLGLRFGNLRMDIGHTTPDVITLQKGLARCADGGARVVAMEVSSHALVQHRLAGVPIHTAVFTNLTRDHLDYHGDMDAYYAAKARLFTMPGLQLAVINSGDPAGVKLRDAVAGSVPVVTFGGDDADVVCRVFEPRHDGMRLVIAINAELVEVTLPLYGRFNVENILAVCAVLYGHGFRNTDISVALTALTPVPGRMQQVSGGRVALPTVLVDYAHTPDALEKALQAVRDHFSGDVHVVIGCGGNRDTGKRPQMAKAAVDGADRAYFTADNPRNENPLTILGDMLAGISNPSAVVQEVDRPMAIDRAIQEAGVDDVVLIAGKGHEAWQEVEGRRIPMNDAVIAEGALATYAGGAV